MSKKPDPYLEIQKGMETLTKTKHYSAAYNLSKGFMDPYLWDDAVPSTTSLPISTTAMWRHAEAINNYMESIPNDKANAQQRLALINEGISALDKCIATKQEDGQCYSWRAVLGSKWGDMHSTKEKIKNSYLVKEYAERAAELIPNDGTAQHVAGAFHYHVANLSWLERNIAATLFHTPPTATFEDAAKHLEKAHTATPNFIRNALMLGDCYGQMGKSEESKKWYETCTKMTPTMLIEENQHAECLKKYKKLGGK